MKRKEPELKFILRAIHEEYIKFNEKSGVLNEKPDGEYWKIRAESLERALNLIDNPEKT